MRTFGDFLKISESFEGDTKRLSSFWATIDPNIPRTPEFYVQTVKKFMTDVLHVINDGIVNGTPETWYLDRAKQMLGFIRNFRGPIYRCISVKNPQEINLNKIGISWSFEESGADCYQGYGGGKYIQLTGMLQNPSDIDVDSSVLYYLIPHYRREKEIRLKPGASIQIINGKILDGTSKGTPSPVSGTATA